MQTVYNIPYLYLIFKQLTFRNLPEFRMTKRKTSKKVEIAGLNRFCLI